MNSQAYLRVRTKYTAKLLLTHTPIENVININKTNQFLFWHFCFWLIRWCRMQIWSCKYAVLDIHKDITWWKAKLPRNETFKRSFNWVSFDKIPLHHLWIYHSLSWLYWSRRDLEHAFDFSKSSSKLAAAEIHGRH